MCLVTVVLIYTSVAREVKKPSSDPSTMRADVIAIDALTAFGDLERPEVVFLHDLHTDALEKKGLVKRVSNPEDRRSILVKLTTSGKQQKNTSPTIDDIFETCCGGLTPEEMKTLVGLLAKLNAAVVT